MLPLSQHKIVRFDVSVDDVAAVQLLHHVQNTDGEVHDQRLRHHFITQGFIDVHRILKEESQKRLFDIFEDIYNSPYLFVSCHCNTCKKTSERL